MKLRHAQIPATGILTITGVSDAHRSMSAGYPLHRLSIMVFDMSGRTIYETKTAGIETSINLSAFDNGIYTVRLTDENGNSVNKKILLLK